LSISPRLLSVRGRYNGKRRDCDVEFTGVGQRSPQRIPHCVARCLIKPFVAANRKQAVQQRSPVIAS